MYQLIDADRHVTEPFALWKEYVDKSTYSKSPVYLIQKNATRGDQQISFSQAMIGDYPVLMNWSQDIQWAASTMEKNGRQERYASMQPVSQLQSMDETGVATAYLFPGFAMNIVNHAEVSSEVSLAYADAYNRWLSDYISIAPKRLKGVGVISRHDPSNMVAQLKKIIASGWTSITLRPEVINGRALGNLDYHSFYKACAENNVAIVFHGGTHLYGNTTGSDRFTTRFGLHACSHPMELQMAFVSLLDSGVLEQNPTLKIGMLEGGCSWIPHWLWRLDNICYPEFPGLVKEVIKKLPSDYFKQHCWVAIEPDEPCIADVVRYIGHKKLVFGTDFPHPDHLGFNLEKDFNAHPALSETMLKDIFENNPVDLFEHPIQTAI